MAKAGKQSIGVLCAVFVLRALIPLGYMPAAISDGLPFVLCPDNLPVSFASGFASGGHDHGDHESATIDQCDFGDLAPDSSALVDLLQGQVDIVPAETPAVPVRAFAERSVIGPNARGPPA